MSADSDKIDLPISNTTTDKQIIPESTGLKAPGDNASDPSEAALQPAASESDDNANAKAGIAAEPESKADSQGQDPGPAIEPSDKVDEVTGTDPSGSDSDWPQPPKAPDDKYRGSSNNPTSGPRPTPKPRPKPR
ncbi:hypothetical protein R3P38DRAFT_3176880 [Favolaschia claudopus]|uniref:Uncharacterized protein n=1 Tax=Favolaschia claudopus TaxID=2862362 RepID=A0AAW0D0X5_9AGAR